jgi:hypothetical protein
MVDWPSVGLLAPAEPPSAWALLETDAAPEPLVVVDGLLEVVLGVDLAVAVVLGVLTVGVAPTGVELEAGGVELELPHAAIVVAKSAAASSLMPVRRIKG